MLGLTEAELLIRQQRSKELQREAAHERLIAEAKLSQPDKPAAQRNAWRWFGRQLAYDI